MMEIGDYDPWYIRDRTQPMTSVPLADKSIYWNVNLTAARVGTNDTFQNGMLAGWNLSLS